MAEALGITPDTVSNYLTGRTRVPRPVLIAWARLCRVPLGWLETGDEILDPTWDRGRAGGNLVVVAKTMGHANIATTMGYAGWNPEARPIIDGMYRGAA